MRESSITKTMGRDPDAYRTGGAPVSTEPFISPEAFDEERRLIFQRTWLQVGRAEDIAEPGAYFVRDLEFAGAQIIVVRGGDGTIRAFHNTCSHRGSAVVLDKEGCTQAFKCPYHAWTYGLDGSLKGIFGRKHFRNVDLEDAGLASIACDVWEGFVFVNLAPEQSLEAFIGSLGERFKDMPFEHYPNYMRLTGLVDVNWRLAIHGNLEMYHFAPLHGHSVGAQLLTAENPTRSFLHEGLHGPHMSAQLPANEAYVPEEDRPYWRIVLGCMIRDAATAPTKAADGKLLLGAHPSQNPAGAKAYATDVFAVFPDLVVMIGRSGLYLTELFRPVSYNTYAWEMRLHYPKPRSFSQRICQEVMAVQNKEIIKEDMRLLETQQRALESRAKPIMRYGDTENLMTYHDAMVAAHLDRGSPARQAAE
jgi:phenylpropionate dioxygenase-like ring-hydroxylating dioxygenase large terminal subunit